MAVSIVSYRPDHFPGIDSLWNEAFPEDPPWNRAPIAIPAKMARQPELFLVALDGDKVVGSIMAGYDGHRGWLYAVAVLKSHRRRGVGTQLVREAERLLETLGCDKVNLQIRSANAQATQFYAGLGYRIEDRISMGRRLSKPGPDQESSG
jgi:ribosomal protein S18 acetylase RimI-like enzyme